LEFLHHQLKNGLTVIAECNDRAYSTALGFFVNTGSRDETPEIAGVSHFLEHMVFKGTDQRSAEDVNRELDEMGSSSNARTGEESTIYHATVLPEFQSPTVELLADIMRPALRDEDFASEQKVIIEEILMYQDQPPFGGHEKIMADFFGDHPLANSVLGTVESVSGLTPESMRDYFRARYSPGNMLLVAAGQVDFEQLVRSAETYCGAWQPEATQRQTPPAQPQLGFDLMLKETAAQEYVLQLCAGPDNRDPLRFACRLLNTILGDESGSRMFWEFIDTGLAEYAGMGAYEHAGCGIIFTMLCCAPEETAANLQRLQLLQQQVQAAGVTPRELQLAQRKAEAQIILTSERSENRLFAIGSGWLRQQTYRSVDQVLADYQAVTMDDINKVLQLFPLSRSRTLAVGPVETLNAIPAV
jgi:predicted Zn-dependent peptidase